MDKLSQKSKRFEDFLENTYFKASQYRYKLTTKIVEEKNFDDYILFSESPTEINTSFEEQVSRQNFAVAGENIRIRPVSNQSRHHLARESININEVESTTDININNKIKSKPVLILLLISDFIYIPPKFLFVLL